MPCLHNQRQIMCVCKVYATKYILCCAAAAYFRAVCSCQEMVLDVRRELAATTASAAAAAAANSLWPRAQADMCAYALRQHLLQLCVATTAGP